LAFSLPVSHSAEGTNKGTIYFSVKDRQNT